MKRKKVWFLCFFAVFSAYIAFGFWRAAHLKEEYGGFCKEHAGLEFSLLYMEFSQRGDSAEIYCGILDEGQDVTKTKAHNIVRFVKKLSS